MLCLTTALPRTGGQHAFSSAFVKKALKPKPMNVLRKPASPHACSGVDTSSTTTALSGLLLRFASVDTKP